MVEISPSHRVMVQHIVPLLHCNLPLPRLIWTTTAYHHLQAPHIPNGHHDFRTLTRAHSRHPPLEAKPLPQSSRPASQSGQPPHRPLFRRRRLGMASSSTSPPTLHRAHLSPKLSPRYSNPYRIEPRIGTVAYKLQLPPSSRIHPVLHVSLLRQFKGIPLENVSNSTTPNTPILNLLTSENPNPHQTH